MPFRSDLCELMSFCVRLFAFSVDLNPNAMNPSWFSLLLTALRGWRNPYPCLLEGNGARCTWNINLWKWEDRRTFPVFSHTWYRHWRCREKILRQGFFGEGIQADEGRFWPETCEGETEVPYRRPCEGMLSRIFHTQLSFLHNVGEGIIGIGDHRYYENLLQGISRGSEESIQMGINGCSVGGTEGKHGGSYQKYLRS